MASQAQKMKRLYLLASMLQQGKDVNQETYKKSVNHLDEDFNFCSKTLQRDLNTLRKDFNAPIKYSRAENNYVLSGSWEFDALSDPEVTSAILTNRIAKGSLPEPVAKDHEQAINSVIATLGVGELEDTAIDSLIVASKTNVTIDSDIFYTVFNAWRSNHAIDVLYRNSSGEEKERRIDPHVISYNGYVWYIKGYCHSSDSNKTFAIHRIKQAVDTGKFYEPDKELIKDVAENGLFGFPKIEGVKVKCNSHVRNQILEQAEALSYIIEADNEELIISLPPIRKRELIRWVLCEAGDVQIIEPVYLRQEILVASSALTEAHT